MSLSWYVMARCRGEPLIALPIFPLRMFIQPYLFCREPSAINDPENLQRQAHRHPAIPHHRRPVGTGNFARASRRRLSELIGSPPNRKARAFASRQINLELHEDLETLLINGELDALILPNVSKSFRAGDPRIQRVFADCRVSAELLSRDGNFPDHPHDGDARTPAGPIPVAAANWWPPSMKPTVAANGVRISETVFLSHRRAIFGGRRATLWQESLEPRSGVQPRCWKNLSSTPRSRDTYRINRRGRFIRFCGVKHGRFKVRGLRCALHKRSEYVEL